MRFGVLEILGLIATAHLLLLGIFLVSRRKGDRFRNRILAAFLFGNGLLLCDFLHVRLGLHLVFPHLLLSGFSFNYLQGPVLYCYANRVAGRDFSLQKKHLLHLLPFGLFWIWMVIVYHSQPQAVKIDLITSDELAPRLRVPYLLLHVQVIVYLTAALLVLRRSRVQQDDRIQAPSVSWLAFGLWVFLVMWSADLILLLTGSLIEVPQFLSYGFSFLAVVLYFVFANLAVFKSLQQPEIVLGEPSTTRKPKYGGSALTDPEGEGILRRLLSHMDEQRPHLRPSVTIDEIARALHVPSRHLSQVINDRLNQRFFDFINRYRIEEAKRLIADSSPRRKTMLEILHEAGFNSKSAFNSAFKKHAGMTPREYKGWCRMQAGE